jgi:hypothetical protein
MHYPTPYMPEVTKLMLSYSNFIQVVYFPIAFFQAYATGISINVPHIGKSWDCCLSQAVRVSEMISRVVFHPSTVTK